MQQWNKIPLTGSPFKSEHAVQYRDTFAMNYTKDKARNKSITLIHHVIPYQTCGKKVILFPHFSLIVIDEETASLP